MSFAVNFIPSVPIADSDLPIALRPAATFPPVRGSIFDDPGDEKSWHVSQRSESLIRFYEGREPSWYASAIAPLQGADRVLDLGCGPGLALQALLEQGSSRVLGIDRWPAFVANSTPEAPIVAHDLSLPMPFLESSSFDGVLSHYALDYVSPICIRQVLREAHRVLAPGGRLVVYLAAVGLGSGDGSRTVSYSPLVMRTLLEEAGFDEIDVEASPNGRNSVARARRTLGGAGSAAVERAGPVVAIEGDTQLSASFPTAGDRLKLELSGHERDAAFAVDLPIAEADEDAPVSVCARFLGLGVGGTELQLWVWRGYLPLVAECARVEFPVTVMRMAGDAEEVGHVSVWQPRELSLEPPGNAYARIADLPTGWDLSEADRGAEGRQVIVEAADDAPVEGRDLLGPGRNRFLIKQAHRLDLPTLDREWRLAQLDGISALATELAGGKLRELLLWCGWRQALLYLDGTDWDNILAVASRRRDEMKGPVVLVDPVLAYGCASQPLPSDVATFAHTNSRFFVLLSGASREQSAGVDLARVSRRLLHGGSHAEDGDHGEDANETLRYLTERTQLMRLRQVSKHSTADVGRRARLG